MGIFRKGSITMYTKIDIESWHRKEYFKHYTENIPCTYSTVVALDITRVYKYSKDHKVKLYPLLLYVLSQSVNSMDAFRYALIEDELVNYKQLSPIYTILNDDESFSSIWTEYEDDMDTFIHNYSRDLACYSNTGKMNPKNEKNDVFSVSMIPWLDFTAFNLNLKNDSKHLTPIFTLGKYSKKEDRVSIPLSIQVHHAVIDGYHVGRFVETLQTICDNF